MDFVVTLDRRVHWLIEVKRSDDESGTSLRYYTKKLQPGQSLQLVLDFGRAQGKSGIKVLSLASWLQDLPFDTGGVGAR